MKANSAKVLGLLLVLALMLSGCNLIEIDAKMQADEDIAEIDAAHAKTVATYNGGEVTAAEAMGDFNAIYNETAYMYEYYFGMTVSEEDVEMMMEDSLAARVRSEIAAAKFDEAHQLSEEETAEMESEIQAAYDGYLESALNSVEGKNEEAKRENARVLLHELGFDYDSLYDSVLMSTKQARMEEILREEISDVSDETLQSVYDAKVAEQEIRYIDGSSFESAMTGEDEIVCWQPEGYRTVKHILVMPEDEIKAAYTDSVYALRAAKEDLEILNEELAAAKDDDLQEGERTVEEIQAEIEAINVNLTDLDDALAASAAACLENVKAVTDEIYARLAAGEDFMALVDEYGEDPGMQNEPVHSSGYYVSNGSQKWEDNFRDASMALASVGDYTLEPVVSGSGVHIILYASDVEAGNVPMEAVRDALYEEALLAEQDTYCEDTINAWVDAAAPSYDLAAFRSAAMGQ